MKRHLRGVWWQKVEQASREVAPDVFADQRKKRWDKSKKARRGALGLIRAMQAPEKTGYSNDWNKIKAVRIAKIGPMCESCKTVMPDEGLTHLHHITPRAQGGRDTDDNAALLCPNCHARAHWLYRQLDKIPGCLAELLEWLEAA